MKLLDNSCLVCLFTEIEESNILSLWTDAGHQVTISTEVLSELSDEYNTKDRVHKNIKNGLLVVNDFGITSKMVDEFENRYYRLGRGELSILLIALALNKSKMEYYAVFDDGLARKTASELGVTFTGTYGLILRLKEKNLIDQTRFNNILKKMHKSGFYININKLSKNGRKD